MLIDQTTPSRANTKDLAVTAAPDRVNIQSVMNGSTKVVERKEHIFHEGDTANQIYRVEIGHVCIYRNLPDGRRQIVDFAYPGEFVGFGSIGQHTANAQAMERTRLRCLPISQLRNIIRSNPTLGLEVFDHISSDLCAAHERFLSVTQRSAQERLACFLLMLAQRNERRDGSATKIVLPMTRADIADYLGLTVETVSRVFSKFRKQGLIDLEQCILVTLVDIETLTEIADGNFE